MRGGIKANARHRAGSQKVSYNQWWVDVSIRFVVVNMGLRSYLVSDRDYCSLGGSLVISQED
jgi:hypothetical protein